MQNALLKVTIRGRTLGLLQQAIQKVLTEKGIVKISFVVESLVYTDDCVVSFIPKYGEVIAEHEKQYVSNLLSDVVVQYGALVAEEDKKPIFRFFTSTATMQILFKNPVLSCTIQVDMESEIYGWISFYKKENYAEESSVKEISHAIQEAVQ